MSEYVKGLNAPNANWFQDKFEALLSPCSGFVLIQPVKFEETDVGASTLLVSKPLKAILPWRKEDDDGCVVVLAFREDFVLYRYENGEMAVRSHGNWLPDQDGNIVETALLAGETPRDESLA
ncbi:uncharacterized protein BCR38DRAFT_485839 [Pseudomassariella vexata]|uniref:Uncharacterized protein n=1 Tax=Pseudomassariella vexata TaxID=1141098 RepID=A0A1Y2DUW2_9PEZI|nr:uncharacterized protein BCR38DRAFT_485839 [Pseudomassariella vexata]ORY63070.1 hypothetical protein BCR38DRAFT_485839 [Pseudomassariella vexata]